MARSSPGGGTCTRRAASWRDAAISASPAPWAAAASAAPVPPAANRVPRLPPPPSPASLGGRPIGRARSPSRQSRAKTPPPPSPPLKGRGFSAQLLHHLVGDFV